MSYGMSRDEYWNGDIKAAFDYVEAENIRQKRRNELMWLQGMYICDAVAVAVHNTVVLGLNKGRGEKATYPDKPYDFEPPEQNEDEDALKAEAWMQQLIAAGKNWGKGELENG